ncbi:MAG: hypothetical protein H6737_11335 [Alphaproteobacteria bacterium]|nr:hypothetical protein [Alphaproteobacteria bacterium]
MAIPVDATHRPDALGKSFARLTLRKVLVEAGFEPVGVAFYPPPNPDLTDEGILYPGEDGREFARRMREGHANEVFVSPDGTAAAEVDTRYQADQIWLATLFANGNVLWTSNAPSRRPKTVFYEPDPDDLRQLDDASRERLETALGCFRAESIVGDVEGAMHRPHPLVGFDIQVLPKLDLSAMVAAHAARIQATRSTPVAASMDVLLACTERAMAVQRSRERFAVGSGAIAVLAGWIVAGAFVWTQLDGAFFWGALCGLGPVALLLGLSGFFMWPTRVGVPLSTWVWPWPFRVGAERALAQVAARREQA